MTKNCYVFCIGGTGVRVLKSIMMLLASGMDNKGFTIVPVCIDPHESLKAKTEINTIINDYCELFETIANSNGQRLEEHDGFFKTEVKRLHEVAGQQNDTSESMSDQREFNNFLDLGNLPSEDINNFLVQTLYSQKNLTSKLSVGFKGSPNVGTVVLSEKIKGANWFENLKTCCQKGDRVFIISSIFGGTGAAGYPLLEKKIREASAHPALQDVLMGAVTVLPYFSLDDPATTNSDIDSKNFLTKTKSALTYYKDHILSDYLYYIGEQGQSAQYENNEKVQADKAHFVELMAASALFDFLTKDDERPENINYMSRSIREDKDVMTKSSLGDGYDSLVKVIADMSLLGRMIEILPDEKPYPLRKTQKFDDEFYKSDEFGKLVRYAETFRNWYNELSTNKRSFSPLFISEKGKPMNEWVADATLDAKDETYYLLEMIRNANKGAKDSSDNKIRHFLQFAYSSIDKYTSKLTK